MPKHKAKLSKGIYRDAYGIRAVVNIAAGRKERRYDSDTPLEDIKRWRNQIKVKLERLHPQKRAGAIGRGTFSAGVKLHLRDLAIASWKSRRSELRAWEAEFGRVKRVRVTDQHVRRTIKKWVDAGVPPKTIQNRVRGLTAMYHALDGVEAWTPADGVSIPKVTLKSPDYASPAQINLVKDRLETQEARDGLDPRWRARYMVLASTGERPVFVRRANPSDVNLDRREWRMDAAKGGHTIRLPLNTEMCVAWQFFVDVDAWGEFDPTEYAKVLRGAGWPEGIRPYATKHSLSQDMADLGIDLETIADWHGHTGGFKTTRIYTGFAWGKLKLASEAIEGRLGWTAPSTTNIVTTNKSRVTVAARGGILRKTRKAV